MRLFGHHDFVTLKENDFYLEKVADLVMLLLK